MIKLSNLIDTLEIDSSIETCWSDESPVEVKQYLPIEQKLDLCSDIINASVDDNGFYNPARVYVNMIVKVVLAYTNIEVDGDYTVTELYDKFVSSGLSGQVIGTAMNPSEYAQIKTWVSEQIHSIYEYKNSVAGILETISQDYSNLDLEASNIQEKIADPNNLKLLKDVLDKLG